MADQIKPVGAIGDAATRRVADYPYPLSAPADATPSNSSRRRLGVPADVVELSVDARTLSDLLPTVYLRFLVDDQHQRVVVQIVDSQTDRVLREVPPEGLRSALRDLRS